MRSSLTDLINCDYCFHFPVCYRCDPWIFAYGKEFHSLIFTKGLRRKYIFYDLLWNKKMRIKFLKNNNFGFFYVYRDAISNTI